MAGFNLFSTTNQLASYDFDGLELSELINTSDFTLNCQTPANYPKQLFLEGRCYLEGSLYADTTDDTFRELSELLEAGKLDEVAQLVRYWDGEFVVIFITDSKIYVVSDSFGRLPMYYSSVGDNYIVSRNSSFVRAVSNATDIDRMQVAVSLLFGMQLGEKTIWKSIQKVPPHAIVEIDRETNQLTVHRYFNLTTVSGSTKLDVVREEIRSVFLDTLERRVKYTQSPTLSLSGGLDSRLIAAGLTHLNCPIPLITYTRKDGQDRLDDQSSQAISQRLEASERHEIIQLGAPTLESAEELLKIKQGFNFLSMSYIVPYYQLHRERSIATITGDGGGKYFVDLYPLRNLRSMRQLMQYLSVHNMFCDFKTAANIAGVNEGELKSYVRQHFEAYPFEDFNDKYTYFLIREAGINWAFEGEDRNRHYSWSTTPFYNPRLIELCLSVPQRSKEYGALFKYLYASFPGNLGAVSNPNWKEVVENEQQVKRIHDRQKLKSRIPTFILNRRKGLEMDQFTFSKELKSAMEGWNNDSLDITQLQSKHSMNFYWQLFTLMKLLGSTPN